MNIQLSFDASVAAAPKQFKAVATAVEHYFESQFTNNITVKIAVGYGEINGVPMSGNLGGALYYTTTQSYSAVRTALDKADHITLPVQGPAANITMSVAEGQALGFLPKTLDYNDGWVGIASDAKYTFNLTNGGHIKEGTYDLFGILAHEITEVLGREMFANPTDGAFTPLDLFHYVSTPTGPQQTFSPYGGYISPPGGQRDLGNLNTIPGRDIADWGNSHDSFGYYVAGESAPVTSNDLQVMNLIGYTAAPQHHGFGFFGGFGGACC